MIIHAQLFLPHAVIWCACHWHTAIRFLLKNSNDGSDGNSGSCYDLPLECPSPGSRPCLGTNFRPVEDGPGSACYTNHQELRVQQQLQCLEPGSVPASITVVLQDELADSCQPGGGNGLAHVMTVDTP